MSVDHFEKISQKREPTLADFPKTQPEICSKFVKYLNRNETRALEVLSAPNFWDRDLFKILVEEFDPGLPKGAFSDLIKYSFIKKDANGKYSIHQLMRKSLLEHQDPVDRKNAHKFMFEHYEKNLKEIDIKSITKEHETALKEAFYHAKESQEAEYLLNWFITVSDPFNKAALWKLIAPIYKEMLRILETKLGIEHPDVATTLNNLARLYESMGDYEKALPLYQRALKIREETSSSNNSEIDIIKNLIKRLQEKMQKE